MPTTLFALILVILFHVSPALAASGDPSVLRYPSHSRIPRPSRDAGGPFVLPCRAGGSPCPRRRMLHRHAPSDVQAPNPAAPGRSTCRPTPASIPRGRSSKATGLPRPWRSCGPWPRTTRTRRTCGFSWAWPPAGGPRNVAGSGTSNGSRCWTKPSRRSGPS